MGVASRNSIARSSAASACTYRSQSLTTRRDPHPGPQCPTCTPNVAATTTSPNTAATPFYSASLDSLMAYQLSNAMLTGGACTPTLKLATPNISMFITLNHNLLYIYPALTQHPNPNPTSTTRSLRLHSSPLFTTLKIECNNANSLIP